MTVDSTIPGPSGLAFGSPEGDKACAAEPPEAAGGPVVRIAPSRGWAAVDLGELWEYRELLVFLAWRDVKVRYKQTLLGAAWAVLVPLLTMVVFNVLFGLLMGRDGRPTVAGVPYAISTYAALVPWQLFAFAMGQSAASLVANRNLITKVYFPRLIAPLAPVLSALVDFAIAFAVLLGIIAAYHLAGEFTFVATWRLALLPVFVALAVLTALALSMWLSALNAVYRDVKYVIPFLTQLLMFVSPVVYTTESIMAAGVPEWARIAYALNPLAGVIEGFRWALFGGGAVSPPLIALSAAMVVALFVGGLFFFRRMERLFADLA